MRACSIEADDVYECVPTHLIRDGEKARRLKPATKNRYLASIRRIFTLSMQAGWVDKVPVLINLTEPSVRVRWITKDQASRLVDALSAQWMRDVCEFALHTGARANEILTLEWASVDLSKSVAWVTNDRAKSGKARALPLNHEAVQLLRRRLPYHVKWVFTNSYGNRPVQTDARVFKRACLEVGIEDFSFHDLRHTWASWHVQAGTPLFILREMGGWETLEMVRKYAHLNAEHLEKYSFHVTFRSQQFSDNKKADVRSALSA